MRQETLAKARATIRRTVGKRAAAGEDIGQVLGEG
jgi:hypothetical protein